MNIADALDQARALAVHTLTDTCTLTRPGAPVRDTLGQIVREPVTVATGVPCLVQRIGGTRSTDSAGLPVQPDGYVAKLPHNQTVEAGWTLAVTASLTGPLIGRSYVVTEAPTQGWSTARRVLLDPT